MRKKVAQRGFTGTSLLNLNTFIEISDSDDAKYPILKDICYLEITSGVKNENGQGFNYPTEHKLFITFDSFELRAFYQGLREVLKNGSTSYKKYATDKVLSITKESKHNESTFNIYINKSEKTTKKSFNRHTFPAFLNSLCSIINELDSIFYETQREIDEKYKRSIT